MQNAYAYALSLLAKQDYSKEQLRRKLQLKRFSTGHIEEVLVSLQKQKLQNDKLLCENLVRQYLENGKGPKFILAKLKLKKIDIQINLEKYDWKKVAFSAYKDKYNGQLVVDSIKEKSKRINFLLGRGFDYQNAFSVVDIYTKNHT